MKELTISLDAESKIPLYQQIYQYLKTEIQRRQILPGECLPSSRALSACLQVSRSTADMAYGQLVSEGYIESVPCRGYFVCDLEGMFQLPDPEPVLTNEKAHEDENYPWDFDVNGIDEKGFPYNQWKKISREVLQEGPSLFELGNPQGEAGLRGALASYLHHARGVGCTPEQIVVGAGNDYLLMLLRVILGDSRQIAMENPTYKSAYLCFSHLGYRVLGIGMDEYGMRMDELEKSEADTAYVMPSHQFPMGNVMPLKRRMQLLSWAAQRESRYILEDDYDSEFRYRGKPIPALQGYDSKERVIYLGTFSKSIAPAIRISYMVLPRPLLKAYEEKGRDFSVTVSKADQKIIEMFIRKGYYERHLNRMRALYKNKHDLLMSLLRQMTDTCQISGENAGLHVVLRFINGLTEKEAIAAAKAVGVRVYGISEYDTSGFERQKSDRIIMGYGAMTEEAIREGTERLKKAWKRNTAV
ncbi:MAG: PLP-dependent aminotransferase family protein [Ruminococcus sp.]|jgi:GntR family transcriptional regulator/MocR family aminotransferase